MCISNANLVVRNLWPRCLGPSSAPPSAECLPIGNRVHEAQCYAVECPLPALFTFRAIKAHHGHPGAIAGHTESLFHDVFDGLPLKKRRILHYFQGAFDALSLRHKCPRGMVFSGPACMPTLPESARFFRGVSRICWLRNDPIGVPSKKCSIPAGSSRCRRHEHKSSYCSLSIARDYIS